MATLLLRCRGPVHGLARRTEHAAVKHITQRRGYLCQVDSTPNAAAVKITPVSERGINLAAVDPETNGDFQFALFDRKKLDAWANNQATSNETIEETLSREIPLVTDIFQSTKNVDQVFVSKYFLSVTFSDEHDSADPAALQPLCETVDDFFRTGPADPDVVSLWQQYTANITNQCEYGEDCQLVEDIQQVLEEKARPHLQADGGDVVFQSYEDGVVALSMVGACASCSSSTITMRFMLKNLLMHYFPEEVEDVVQADHMDV